MTCPFCGHREDKVIDFRESKRRRLHPPPPSVPGLRTTLYHL